MSTFDNDLKPNIRPVENDWCDRSPGPGAVHHGLYTPILKPGQGGKPREIGAGPRGFIFEPPVKPRTTI